MIQAIKRHLKRSGLTRRNNSSNNNNNSNKQRKEDGNGLENVSQCCPPDEIGLVNSNTSEIVPVKLMTQNEPSPVPVTNKNNNNNNNVININNQRNQHNQRHHHADLSSPESSSSSYCNEKWRRRTGGNDGDGQRPNGQRIVDDATSTDLISPSAYHDDDDNGANQSTNCAQVNEKHQKHQQQQHIDNHDDNLNSNTMTVDSDNHLKTSSLVNEAYRTECIQLRQRVRELEQQNRLLTLLLAEQLLNSSTNSVGNQSKLDKLIAINSLTNNQPQLISEYESSILMDNNGNHDDEVSNIIMNLSSSPGQGQITSNGEGKGTTSESDLRRSMGNNHPDHHQSNNNNHHHHDDETSDRLVSMSECNSMLGVNLTHVNIDRWGMMRVDDKSKTITTTTTTSTAQQLTLQPNLPVNQLTNQLLPSSRTTINSVNCKPISSLSFGYLDSRKKSSYINNLVTNSSTLFTSSSSSSTSSSTTTTTTTADTTTTSSSTSSSSGPFSTSNTVLPTLPDTTSTTTTTISTLTSTLIGSPSSSSPPQSPKKLISSSSILDSSLFQSTTTNNPVNCSSSSINQLEKRILFILASNNNQCYNSTFSSTSSSSSSVSTENNNNKINCDNTNRLINKPGNLTLRTLSGSSSSLKDNNNSLLSSSSIKSIVSLEKDSPASSATSFDSNGELTSKDEGYSTMSSDVQSDIGGSGNINNTGSSSIVTINTSPLTTTVTPTTTTINNQNELTINSLFDDKQSTINNGNTTKINKSFIILNSPPSRTNQPPPPQSQSTSSLSTLIHLKQHQQLKGETIEIKSEPKKMGINGSPTNSIPLTIMSIVNPIVVGSSRLTTFKSSKQNDCLSTSSSSSPTINNNGKNNKTESLLEDVNYLTADTIKLNCNNNGNTVTTTSNNNSSQSIVRTTIKTGNINSNLLADNKSSSWLNNNTDGTNIVTTNGGNESQLVNCFTSLVNNNGPHFIRKARKTANGKSSTHRYTFPPVTTRTVTTTTTAFDGIEWTPCLIYQPSKSTFDPNVENLINESRLIVTAEKSTSADFDDDKDETKCLVNNRGLINCEEKRKRSGKYHHHHHHQHHLGKDDYVNDDQQQFDGKTNEVNQVKSESVGEGWRIKVGGGGGRRKSSVSKVADSGSLVMKATRNTIEGDDEDEYYENEEEDEEIEIHHKIDQKRKLKVHHKLQAPPPPGSSSSSYESHSLTRWHSDSQLYSDSLIKQDTPLKGKNGKQVNLGRPPSNHHHRSPRHRHRDITSVHLLSQSFSPSTGKRSSGYIRRRIKREDRARLDESHRWSTLSTSSSALSDGLEAPPIYFERRRCRPRLSMATDNTIGSIGIGTNLKNTTGPSGRLSKYISSDENHSADDEDSAERFVSRWLHKSGGGLRWDDSEVTWKLNESIDWPEPIELEDPTCLNHLSPYITNTNTTSSPSSSTSAAAIKPSSSSSDDDDEDDNRITNHLNYNDDTFEEIPLIDDDSSESEKIEITTINSNNYHHHNHLRNSYSVLISPCDDEEEVGCNGSGGGIDISHEGGGEGYVSSDQASSVPDDGLTPETHFNGDFYRLCSVGSRTSLQQPDDEISLPPSSSGALSSLSSSPPLTDVKEQDEEEQDDNSIKNNANYQNDNETNLQQLSNLNDLDNDYDELLVITTTTSIDGKNHHQLKSSKLFNYPKDKQSSLSSSLIKSQSSGFSGQQSSSQSISPLIKLDQSNQQQIVTDLKQINSSQSAQCLSSSSSSPGKSVKFGQFNINNNDNENKQTKTSTINTGSESQSIDCKQVCKGGDEQLTKPINAVEKPINGDSNGHRAVKDNCHIYEEINQTESASQLTTKPDKPMSPLPVKVNCYPKPILIKSSSTNQASSSPTRIPLPKQSNSLDAIKSNNKDGVKLRFNSTTTMIDSITNNHNNNNNVNNLITKSFINQHQVKRLNNNMMVNQQQQQFIQPSTSSSPSSSLLMSKKIGTESRSKMMMIELKGKMERNNNQVNHNRSSNRNKSNQSIPSLEEFERRLSEDKQMADKIREFYSIFEQSTQSSSSSLPTTTTTTTTTSPPSPPSKPTTITTQSKINSTVTSTIPPSIKAVKSNRSRSTISGDLIRGIKLGNNEKPGFEDIKSKLNYPKLLRSKGVVASGSTGSGTGSGCGGGGGSNNNGTVGSDSGKTMKEGHETSWVHVSGFTVGKVSEQPPPPPPPPSSSSSLTSPSPSSAINSITTSINCNNNNVKNLTNSGKLSSDSCSSEDEFNLGKIHGNGNGGKKRSSFHQRLLALHRSRRQRKRASDCYMGMSFLPKIRASIVDRLDFYHRFGDKEQEALTSFNFLNDLPPTTTTTINASTTPITTHSNPKSPKSFDSSGSINFVEEQQLLLRCYLNSFQPLSTSSSSSTQSLPPPPPLPQPPSSSSSSSSSSFTLSSYKWPQSPVKSSSSSPNRYQSSVGNNYILNHELTKRPVGGVS